MADIVAVHGILNEFRGVAWLEARWRLAILDGLRLAGSRSQPSVCCAFYGDLFRSQDPRAGADRTPGAEEVAGYIEKTLLLEWWSAVARPEARAISLRSKAGLSGGAQRAINALLNSRAFKALAGDHAERALLFQLRQVRLYFEDETIRQQALGRVNACLDAGAKVVIAHSLGSVVAYEALCARQEDERPVLVTLGSPLGLTPVVFDRLRPAPAAGRGALPTVREWHNIADDGDPVALVKRLCPLFGSGAEIRDVRVGNGWESHNVLRYLKTRETGEAIASGL